MNESWPMMNTSMLAPHKKPDPVSSADINSLLKGRTFHAAKEDVPFNMCPEIPVYDQNEMDELQAYCKMRGIIGVNFNGMNPRTVLNMLKGKTEGKHSPKIQKGILHG